MQSVVNTFGGTLLTRGTGPLSLSVGIRWASGKKHLHLQICPPPRHGHFRSGGPSSCVVFSSESRGRALAGSLDGRAKAGHSRLPGPRVPFRGGKGRHVPAMPMLRELPRRSCGWIVQSSAGLSCQEGPLALGGQQRTLPSVRVFGLLSTSRKAAGNKAASHKTQRPSGVGGGRGMADHLARFQAWGEQIPGPESTAFPVAFLGSAWPAVAIATV